MPIFSSFSSSPARALGTTSASKPGRAFNIIGSDIGSGRAFNNGAVSVAFEHKGVKANFFTVTSSGNHTATGNSSPIIVEGLDSNISYTFTVTATNSIGTSKVSDNSAAVTATTVPQAPTLNTFSSNSLRTSAISSFTTGATGGKTITQFSATRSGPATVTGSTSPLTFTGLTSGTTYTSTVVATNANGTSLPSNEISATTFNVTGGTVSVPGDGFVYHTFTSNSSFMTSNGSKSIEILLVAGGGGAGGYAAGGGGAGGLVNKSLSFGSDNTYSVTIGGGGGQSGNGGNSVISGSDITTQTANGGGHGGSNGGGTVGGSGGGGSKFGAPTTPSSNLQPNTATGGFGNFGGNGGAGDVDGGGGGGGAGGAGGGAVPEAAGGHSGGTGGAGRNVWGTVYATGGNGTGRFRYSAIAPTANTGNGGYGSGASGASGICRIRYADA